MTIGRRELYCYCRICILYMYTMDVFFFCTLPVALSESTVGYLIALASFCSFCSFFFCVVFPTPSYHPFPKKKKHYLHRFSRSLVITTFLPLFPHSCHLHFCVPSSRPSTTTAHSVAKNLLSSLLHVLFQPFVSLASLHNKGRKKPTTLRSFSSRTIAPHHRLPSPRFRSFVYSHQAPCIFTFAPVC